MPDPWNPEREWLLDEVREVIRVQCPEITCSTVAHFGSGWDNAAFLIDDQWVFRFAQRRIAVPWLVREWEILPRLAPRMTVSIPHPIWFGRVEEWTFLGYPRLKGCPASDLAIDQRGRFELARPLGRFLRVLHNQPTHDFAAQPDALKRFNIEVRRLRAVEMLADCDAGIDVAPLRRLLNDVDLNPGEIVLSHGDLYSRHLLIDQGRLSGVIDWGDICLAEIAHDLMLVYCFFPPEARGEFFAEYGTISSSTASRARFRAICHTLHVYHYARSTGDAPLLAEAELSLRSIGLE